MIRRTQLTRRRTNASEAWQLYNRCQKKNRTSALSLTFLYLFLSTPTPQGKMVFARSSYSLIIFLIICWYYSLSHGQVVSQLLQEYTYSHLAIPTRLALFWSINNDTISYAILGIFPSTNPNGNGWIATGWNPTSTGMVGSIAVMGLFPLNIFY
jgi:hypothetical protein